MSSASEPAASAGESIQLTPTRYTSPDQEIRPEFVADDETVLSGHEFSGSSGQPLYPQGLSLVLLFGSACLSGLLVELDQQILATAIPSITDTFGTIADIGWYSSGYRLSICGFQFMFGKLYRTYPIKTLYTLSLLIFEVGSAICGAAPSSAGFIVGRIIAGVGASGVLAGCYQIMTVSFPLRYRPMMTGLAVGVEGIAIVAGPLLGGLITDYINWRWCFYINLPFGAVTILLALVFLKDPPSRPPNADLPWREKITQLDLIGTAMFIPSITCLFAALQFGSTNYGWKDVRTILLFVIFGILLGVFLLVQLKYQDKATLPPRIIRQRSILAGFVFSFCMNSALNVIVYYLPTYLQVVKGKSPAKAGILMMPMLGGFILSMIFAGSAVSLVGYYVPFMLAASIMTPIASGLLTTLEAHGPSWHLIFYEVLFGMSAGIGLQSPLSAVQTTLPDVDVSMGLNIIVFAQNFGPALSISIAQSLFTSRLVSNLREYIPDISSETISSLGLTNIKSLVPSTKLNNVLLGYDRAITQTFYLSVALTCLAVIGTVSMEWRSVKEKRN